MKSSVCVFHVFIFSNLCAMNAFGSAADIARIEDIVRKVLLVSGQYAG